MEKTRSMLIAFLVIALAGSIAMLAACSQPAPPSTSKDTLNVSTEPKQEEPPEPAIELKTEPFYVLVIGNDSREGTVEINKSMYSDGKGRADTMMLARIDPKKYKITLITVPRDTEVTYEGEQHKINQMLYYEGPEGQIKAVEELTGATIDHYVMCKFTEFQKLVNDEGGLAIDVMADQSMQDIVSGDYIEFPAGWYDSLNGAEALVYARERHAYNDNQEALRQSNDRHIVQCLIEQVLNSPKDGVELATKLLDDIETDWDTRELLAYAEDFIKNADKVSFMNGSGPWAGDFDPNTGNWIAWRDPDTWSQLMAVVDEGGDPNEVLQPPSFY